MEFQLLTHLCTLVVKLFEKRSVKIEWLKLHNTISAKPPHPGMQKLLQKYHIITDECRIIICLLQMFVRQTNYLSHYALRQKGNQGCIYRYQTHTCTPVYVQSIKIKTFPIPSDPKFLHSMQNRETGRNKASYSPVVSKLLNNPCVYNHHILSNKESVLILVKKICSFSFFEYLNVAHFKIKGT